MNENSTRRVGVITGASGGIGEATAQGLAEAGFDVALLAHNKVKINQMAADQQDASSQEAPTNPLY